MAPGGPCIVCRKQFCWLKGPRTPGPKQNAKQKTHSLGAFEIMIFSNINFESFPPSFWKKKPSKPTMISCVYDIEGIKGWGVNYISCGVSTWFSEVSCTRVLQADGFWPLPNLMVRSLKWRSVVNQTTWYSMEWKSASSYIPTTFFVSIFPPLKIIKGWGSPNISANYTISPT